LVCENIQKKYQVVGCNVKDERRKAKGERRRAKGKRQKAKGEKNTGFQITGAFSPEPFASFLNIKPFDNMRQPVVLFSHA